MMKLAPFAVLFALMPLVAHAVDPDECEQQRAQYPATWNDVSRERALFTCSSHYSNSVRLMLGRRDDAGRRLLSVVPLKGKARATQDPTIEVYRIWLDKEQALRLLNGKYFATALRRESSCWIRGSLDADPGNQTPVFFMDNTSPRPDGVEPRAGSFYNKAPRFSVFLSNAYYCKPD